MSLMGMEDDLARVVREAQAGSTDAFGLATTQCWNGLVRFARSVVGEADAEDAVQDALLSAWRGLGSLDDAAKFPQWMTTIVFHRCLRMRRFWRLQVALDGVGERGASQDPAPDLDVAALLARLPPRQRAVLHLTLVEGMTDTEIGRVLQMAPGSVRAQRRRARARLARVLEKRR
ncbi:MAG: sigma-70 family RNA polymerase sigma factor [Vicinamibacteraceae bacterium]|nr:sigma-70 family RNA polymerase sigma factor [Vicinamibacteraceae bacterium]